MEQAGFVTHRVSFRAHQVLHDSPPTQLSLTKFAQVIVSRHETEEEEMKYKRVELNQVRHNRVATWKKRYDESRYNYALRRDQP